MPHRLKKRQEKLQEKRKNTPWRGFVKEICSLLTINYKKYKGQIHKGYSIERIGGIVTSQDFEKVRNDMYGDMDLKSNFFENYFHLQKKIKLPGLTHFGNNENCEYAESVIFAKNIYLSVLIANNVKNILYSLSVIDNSSNCIGSTRVATNCENIFESTGITNSYNVFFSKDIYNCSDVWCSSHCFGCHNIYNCNNLKNKSYCINNIEYSKEEYKKKVKKIHYFKKYKHGKLSYKMFDFNSEDIENGFYVVNTKKSRNSFICGTEVNNQSYMYDVVVSGRGNHYYGTMGVGLNSEHIYCSYNIVKSLNIYYSYYLENCSYCLGCIGLKNKFYCILNKQYTKEERYDKVDEIFTQMEKDGQLGKFFPGSMNPFYFNDTAAYLIDDSFTKEEVEAEGYLRRDEKIKVDIPEGAEIVYSESTIDDYQGRKVKDKFYPLSQIGNKTPKADSGAERWIDPEILKKVIQDKEGNYYKIVKMEYDFLMKHGLPLPKLHWLDRIKLGFKFK